jgi:tetratricopeptide (TPR) repeat protein
LELDDTLSQAHAVLGGVKADYEWDWPGAQRELQRAIEVNPNYASAHQVYSEYLFRMGRGNDALAEVKRAQELDPLSPITDVMVGVAFYWTGQYDEAIQRLRAVAEIEPLNAYAHGWLGLAYQQKAMMRQAITEFQQALTLSGGNRDLRARLGLAYGISGRRKEALEIVEGLKSLRKQRYVKAASIAGVYVGLGENDQAFEWLEKAYQERDFQLTYLAVEPAFDSLRSDPRYTTLLQRLGLPSR